MKSTRRLSRLLLLLLVTTLPALAEKVVTLPAPTGYVDDYAGVISAPAKTDIEDLCRELHDKTKAQVFLVTINTLEGETASTFANELFAKWKIGEKKTDRGVLLLFAIKDHKRWIEVGYGLEGILNDAKVGDIGREMVPDLQAANYDDATKLGVREVSRIIAADSAVTLDNLNDSPETESEAAQDETADARPPTSDLEMPTSSRLAIALVLGPALFMICFMVWRFRSLRGRGGTGGTGLGSGSSFDSGSDSSSFGSSSSDDSFGGGDGGFSGGGGAGGDW
jgi:uncharacterized protein